MDPMCGSGTFLIEAALIAQGKPPGSDRSWWPFYSWPDFDKQAWQNSSDHAHGTHQLSHSNDIGLLGNDIHEGSLSLALRQSSSHTGNSYVARQIVYAGVTLHLNFIELGCLLLPLG